MLNLKRFHLTQKNLCFGFKYYSDKLLTAVECKIKEHREIVKKFRAEHNKTVVGEITVDQLYTGMRGMLGFICETSQLDAETGITFRGHTLQDIQEKMPRFDKGHEPMPEGMFWLLLTDNLPTKEEVKLISDEWQSRSKLPDYAVKIMNSLPKTLHPMSQFAIGIQALQHDSKAAHNRKLVEKIDFWKCVLEDAMDCLGKVTTLAAYVYNNTYKEGEGCYEMDPNLDWSANYLRMMGFNDPNFDELMRLYLTVHCDHEGGNVSAHTSHLVGSALSDPFISLAAGMNGLAGPRHGLANQEVLIWLDGLVKAVGETPSDNDIKDYVKDYLKPGVVIPGYGHAVLRVVDPRFTYQQQFAQRIIPNDPLINLVAQLYKVIPDYLKSLKKIKNPYPNVDAHSGVLLKYFGLKQMHYYTVLFGVSRAIGILAQAIWDHALLMPMERPKTLTTESLMKRVKDMQQKKK